MMRTITRAEPDTSVARLAFDVVDGIPVLALSCLDVAGHSPLDVACSVGFCSGDGGDLVEVPDLDSDVLLWIGQSSLSLTRATPDGVETWFRRARADVPEAWRAAVVEVGRVEVVISVSWRDIVCDVLDGDGLYQDVLEGDAAVATVRVA